MPSRRTVFVGRVPQESQEATVLSEERVSVPINRVLTPSAIKVYDYIKEHSDCLASEVARHTGTKKATVSHHVKQLCELGLISQRRSREDRRRFVLRVKHERWSL